MPDPVEVRATVTPEAKAAMTRAAEATLRADPDAPRLAEQALEMLRARA